MKPSIKLLKAQKLKTCMKHSLLNKHSKSLFDGMKENIGELKFVLFVGVIQGETTKLPSDLRTLRHSFWCHEVLCYLHAGEEVLHLIIIEWYVHLHYIFMVNSI